MIKDETIKRIREMENTPPIENPCPKMSELGYSYNYRKGLVDATPHYTRVEEDAIIYTGKRYNIQFNLAGREIVLVMHEDNADYYGNKPTFFVSGDLMECIDEITEKLGWKE